MVDPAVIRRLITAAGVEPPRPTAAARRILSRCAEDARLFRAIAWYGFEVVRGLPPERLLEGLAALCGGWGDYYVVASVTRGARTVDVPPTSANGIAVRLRRRGHGGRRGRLAERRLGPVRGEIRVAAQELDRRYESIDPRYARARTMEKSRFVDVDEPLEHLLVLADAWEEAGFHGVAAKYRAFAQRRR